MVFAGSIFIDEMWHNFILFTPDYHAFSQKYFGEYFHHKPARKNEKNRLEKLLLEDPEQAKNEYYNKLKFMMSVTYDHLGEDTLSLWFKEYPVRYSKEAVFALKKSKI